ncbi:MAG: glycerophosphodiester phosphodiesterase [Oscillospiraceae bacterium]|jgi:glycerophosphoryl diester phosphodiesterase
MQYPYRITAHSGCEGTPRDSKESIIKALTLGADVVEVDVRRAPDGTLVISHDRKDSYSGMLSLQEAMELVAEDGKIGINCDIKEAEVALDVLQMAQSLGITKERLILSGGLTPAQLRASPQIIQQCNPYLNLEEIMGEILNIPPELAESSLWESIRDEIQDISPYLPDISRIFHEVGAKALNLPYTPLTQPCFDLAQEIPLSAWTINELAVMEKMIRLGVVNLTTLNVKLAMQLRETIPTR